MTMLHSYDPRTAAAFGEPIASTEPAELDRIAAAASAAAQAWREADPLFRAEALRAIADALDANAERLAELADRETALGVPRLTGEVGRTTGQLRMFADLVVEGSYVDAVITQADPARGRPDVRRMMWPIGPVAVFSASNFPFAFSVAGGDTASALAVGCPVIVKAHSGHPATSAAVAEIIIGTLAAVGAPSGLFGIVYGTEAGRHLVQHPAVAAVGFTGSTTGGRALFDLASGRPDPIPFFGELGSVNPVVILPHAARADLIGLATGYVSSLTLGVGQFCTNPNLLFVPQDSGMAPAIGQTIRKAAGGALLTERVHAGYVEALADPAWTELSLVGGGTADGPWSAVPEVRQVSLADVGPDLLDVERFGPAGLVVTYASVEELLIVLGGLAGSLTATIHADIADIADTARVITTLSRIAGRLVFNGWPTGVSVCWAMHHGGPWPATTAAGHTSVGGTALRRWLAPVAYQDFPDELLPAALREGNPLGLHRVEQPVGS